MNDKIRTKVLNVGDYTLEDIEEIYERSAVMQQYMNGVDVTMEALQNWNWSVNPERVRVDNPNNKPTQQAMHIAFEAGRLMAIAQNIEMELFRLAAEKGKH